MYINGCDVSSNTGELKVTKLEMLRSLKFGERVAEYELDDLGNYFLETEQWNRIFAGEIDVVMGPKGSGKSAIYALLQRRKKELFDRGIQIIPAENLRGTPAFAELVSDPPTSASEFINLWKLYFVALIGGELQRYSLTEASREVICQLQDASLLPESRTLTSLLKSVVLYVRSWAQPKLIEGSLQYDPTTGTIIGSGKIVPNEPSLAESKNGYISINRLYDLANEALSELSLTIWILLDRLDVAFADSTLLETNALRALFRVYLDLRNLGQLQLKIFLRSDIWERLKSDRIPEASHIIRSTTIEWDQPSLLNLLVRRILQNGIVATTFNVNRDTVLQSLDEQESLFYRMFPRQVDVGQKKPNTFEWMLSRIKDGKQIMSPRELIHLVNEAKNFQIRKLENGEPVPGAEHLFASSSLKAAIVEVSRVRLEQTLYPEYPAAQKWIQELKKQRTTQTLSTLSGIWRTPLEDTENIVSTLIDIGFFERSTSKDRIIALYRVPFLYRYGLGMIQGSAG